eukprot:CAMPEP_0172817650 /NCGR_PEP_ID=MMETSP1075-20121228/13354_1 /TAXON_ID=2916 /ORGANISM="Ceratium fusus, Strain PA161109" /LENGTH=115 /DNA_ID=CAMNT_0013657887 /DNA_START=524 /DNA_END=869 /DNA_ORIENTATION=-
MWAAPVAGVSINCCDKELRKCKPAPVADAMCGAAGVPALLIAGLHPCLGATPLWRQQGWAARLRLQVEAAAAIAAAVLARVRTAPGGSAFHQSYFGDVPKLTAVTPLNGGVLWIQ